MRPRIAIPVPTSFDSAYNNRSWPQYAQAVERAGGEPVAIPLNDAPAATAKLIASCTGVLLPGSGADVNPQKYDQPLHPAAAPPDPARENVDELLLQDAHNMGKPLLAICFGTQILNVWRGGSLVQDLPHQPVDHKAGREVLEAHPVDIAPNSLLATLLQTSEVEQLGRSGAQQSFVISTEGAAEVEKPASAPAQTQEAIHQTQPLSFRPEPRSGVVEKPASAPAQSEAATHQTQPLSFRPEPRSGVVEKPASAPAQSEAAIHQTQPLSFRPEPRSGVVEKPASAPAQTPLPHTPLQTTVNSSHHQAINTPGDGLFIAARSTHDGVIEAIEGGHGLSDRDRAFLLGIQWHPERTYDHSAFSRAIFSRFIAEAAAWSPRRVTTSVG